MSGFPLLRALVYLAVTVLLSGCSRTEESMALPGPVTTAAGGFPLALQMQAREAPGTCLVRVLVVLDRDSTEFKVSKIVYGFAPILSGSRSYSVTVDNATHRAAGTNDTQGAQGIPGPERLPVSLAGKDVWEVLQIAKESGLNDFCAFVSPGHESILFQLESPDVGPVWHITADGWDPVRGTVLLRIDIDAGSGAVTRRDFRVTPKR